MYSLAFVKPDPALTARAAQKADCIPGRVCEHYSYAGSGWGWQSFAISPSHGSTRLQLTYYPGSHIFLQSQDFAAVFTGIFIRVRAVLFSAIWACFGARVTRAKFVCFTILNPKVSALACTRFQEQLFQNRQSTLLQEVAKTNKR